MPDCFPVQKGTARHSWRHRELGEYSDLGNDGLSLDLFISLQRSVAATRQKEKLSINDLKNLCGHDVSYGRERAVAAPVLLSFRKKKLTGTSCHTWVSPIPYVPGLLCMRESPIFVEDVRQLSARSDIILEDGHCVAHPRRAGSAVFVGLVLGIPTMGVEKFPLAGTVGDFEYGIATTFLDSNTVGLAVASLRGSVFLASQGYGATVEDTESDIQLMGSDYPLGAERGR